MLRRSLLFIATTSIVVMISYSVSLAFWQLDGAAICSLAQPQTNPVIVPDGNGGAIMAWQDYRSVSNYDIYAQRVDKAGNNLWTVDGVAACTEADNQMDVAAVSDGAGGVIVAWADFRNSSDYNIYAQRLDAYGNRLWLFSGVPICVVSQHQRYPVMVTDGSGGAIIAWEDMRYGSQDIFAQRINSGGNVMWTTGGNSVTAAGGTQRFYEIVSDGSGGAILTWEDNRTTWYNIYAQRLDGGGIAWWTLDGTPVCAYSTNQFRPAIETDGAGGAIIAWEDFRNISDYDIYAQRLSAAGSNYWASSGVRVCGAVYSQITTALTTDGAGGAIVTWRDGRFDGLNDIYAQLVDASGVTRWVTDGVGVCRATNHQGNPAIGSDGSGGAILSWEDYRTGVYDIYSQRIDNSGAPLWAVDGMPVCTAVNTQYIGKMFTTDEPSAFLVWSDPRSADNDIYAQALDEDGNWGFPVPVIHEIRDVPGDQGGLVNLAWEASYHDPNPNMEITHYTLWRALGTAQAEALIEKGAALVDGPEEMAARGDGDVIRIERLESATYFWKLIDSQDAYHLYGYSMDLPTLFDSTGVSSEYHHYQVIAHTPNSYVFWVSKPDSGYSVDNLAPAMPQALAGHQTGVEGIDLTWDPNNEEDLSHYFVYRGLSPDFTPDDGNRLGATVDTLLADGNWTWSGGYYYKVSAVDIHGNESLFAWLGPNLVVGAGDSAPGKTYLEQNRPNPFNPSTAISFGLAEPVNVTLRIYDASGRLVRTLADRRYEAGKLELTWNGRDDAGHPVASGIYFYRLSAGSNSITKKMILLK